MRTRRSKLTEDAEESDGTAESSTNGKPMNVDVIAEESTSDAVEVSVSSKTDPSSSQHLNLDYDSIISSDISKNDKEISASEVPNQGKKAPPITSTEEVASESITTEEGVSSNISQTVEGASGSGKMEDASSSKVEGGSLTNSPRVEGGDSKVEHTLDESVAAEEMTADALTMETDSSSTTVPNALIESQKNSIQIEGSPSITLSEGDTSNMEGTPEKSIDSGSTFTSSTIDESCVLAKREAVSESLKNKMHELTAEEKKAIRKDINEKKARFRIIGRKFCEEKNIPFPNQRSYNNIVYDLHKNQKLDEKNLEIKLEEAAQIKLKASADAMKSGSSATSEEKIIGGKGKSDVDPNKSISEKGAVRRKVDAKFEEYKDIAVTYCKSKKFQALGRKQFKEIMRELASKQKLNEEELKVALDKNNLLSLEVASWNGARSTKSRLDAKGERIPSVKKITEMTIQQLTAFFEEFKTLQATMKPIAIKHCHTIKAPFPKKRYYTICRDLFEIGKLDEKNIKRAIEVDFEERCDLPVTDDQVNMILRRYCADKGIADIGFRRMKAEILPKMPKKLLSRKQFWNVMYKEQQTNLFNDEQLNLVTAKKDTQGKSKPSSAASEVKKNGAKTGGVATEPKSVNTNGESNTPRKRIRQRKRNRVWDDNNQSESLHAMGLPWSNTKVSKMTENSPDRYVRNPWNTASSGASHNATSLSYTDTFPQRLDEVPIEQFLVQTQQWIAEKARMLGGLDSQESVVSQSLPTRKESRYSRSKMRWEKKQEQLGKRMNLPAQRSVAGERFPMPLGERDHSQSQPWRQDAVNVPDYLPSAPVFQPALSDFQRERNFSGRNLMIANFTSHTNITGAFGGQGSSAARPAWSNEPHMENRGLNSAGIPSDDYSRNSGFGENSRHLGTGFGGHSLGRDYEDPMVGTSERGWSERDRFSPPRKNKTNWDDLGRGNNELKRSSELLESNCPPPPIISTPTAEPAFRNSQEPLRRSKDDDDWRFARGAPPQKKSRFVEDRQPEPSQSVDLQRVVNEFKSRFAENRMSSEPLNPSMYSRRSQGQASPTRIGDQSKMVMMKGNPPLLERGKTCKVAIVHEDYPRRRITDQEAGLIYSALLERIGVQSGIGPRFSDSYEEGGAAIFECEDQLTVSWLWVNASTIIPWRSAKLRAISWGKPSNEITILVPKLLERLTPQALCDRLTHQNPGLSTESWKLKLSDSTSSKGLNMVFYIDDGSMKTLKSLDLRPYLGLSRVTVQVNQE